MGYRRGMSPHGEPFLPLSMSPQNRSLPDPSPPEKPGFLPVVHLGRMPYAPAYERQSLEVDRVIAQREASATTPAPNPPGLILLVEHDPVITVTRRGAAAAHVVATAAELAHAGVAVQETDRGGDVTYHGPGQLVAYPILDLNALGLRLHDYMRLLEGAIIRTCADFGVATHRDADATGVWTGSAREGEPDSRQAQAFGAKIAALGVRVRRWVSMHGLALNVTTNLDHFRLIVPCGLARPVTSLHAELGASCPAMNKVQQRLIHHLDGAARAAFDAAAARRATGAEH